MSRTQVSVDESVDLPPRGGAAETSASAVPPYERTAYSMAIESSAAIVAAALSIFGAATMEEPPSPQFVKCVARTVFYEARSEPIAGQFAVADAVINRTRQPSRGGRHDPCSVIREPGQFAPVIRREHTPGGSAGADRQWRTAVEVAVLSLAGYSDSRCDNATTFVNRRIAGGAAWLRRLKRACQIGNHVFFSDPKDLPETRVSVAPASRRTASSAMVVDSDAWPVLAARLNRHASPSTGVRIPIQRRAPMQTVCKQQTLEALLPYARATVTRSVASAPRGPRRFVNTASVSCGRAGGLRMGQPPAFLIRSVFLETWLARV